MPKLGYLTDDVESRAVLVAFVALVSSLVCSLLSCNLPLSYLPSIALRESRRQ